MTDLTTTPLSPPERARVHATAWAILGDPHDADDVAQELALRLQGVPDAGDPRVRWSWIARTALGMSLNRRRGERRRGLHERAAGFARARRWVEPPERPLERAEDLDRIRRALAGLDERHRLPLILRYFHDRRLNEIAGILGIPVSTAHERLQGGLARMRGSLRRADVAPALLGLALPRATAWLLPAAAIGRASVLVGGSWSLARAAALLALLGLYPLVRLSSEVATEDLVVASAPAAPGPGHSVTPPWGPPATDEIEAAGRPPGGEERPPLDGPGAARPPGAEATDTPTTPDAPDRSLVAASLPLRPEATPRAPGRGHLLDADGSPASHAASEDGSDPMTGLSGGPGSDVPDDPPVAGANHPGAGDDDDTPSGGMFGGAFGDGPLTGQVTGFGDDEPLGGVQVVLVPFGSSAPSQWDGQWDGGDEPPIAFTATTDDEGRFELVLPPGAWEVRVGLPAAGGGFDAFELRTPRSRLPGEPLLLEVES